MIAFFKTTLLTYALYLIEFFLLILITLLLFKIENPNADILSRINIIFKDTLAWTIVFRTIYGYSIALILLLLLLKHKGITLSGLNVAIASITSYVLISLLYALVLLPDTKEFLTLDLTYNGGYFYYSVILTFFIPLILGKIGFIKLLALE